MSNNNSKSYWSEVEEILKNKEIFASMEKVQVGLSLPDEIELNLREYHLKLRRKGIKVPFNTLVAAMVMVGMSATISASDEKSFTYKRSRDLKMDSFYSYFNSEK